MLEPPGNLSDADLLRAWQTGDGAAGDELVERHYGAVLGFMRARLGSTARAEELAQDVFLKAHEKRGQIETSVRGYLFGVAWRTLRDHVRKRGTHEVPDVEAAEALVAEDPSPSAEMAKRRAEDVLVRAVRSLSLDDQLLLALKDLAELPSREIAAALGIGDNQVRGKLNQARGRLRGAVERLTEGCEGLRDESLRHLDSWALSVARRVEEERPSFAARLRERGSDS